MKHDILSSLWAVRSQGYRYDVQVGLNAKYAGVGSCKRPTYLRYPSIGSNQLGREACRARDGMRKEGGREGGREGMRSAEAGGGGRGGFPTAGSDRGGEGGWSREGRQDLGRMKGAIRMARRRWCTGCNKIKMTIRSGMADAAAAICGLLCMSMCHRFHEHPAPFQSHLR